MPELGTPGGAGIKSKSNLARVRDSGPGIESKNSLLVVREFRGWYREQDRAKAQESKIYGSGPGIRGLARWKGPGLKPRQGFWGLRGTELVWGQEVLSKWQLRHI